MSSELHPSSTEVPIPASLTLAEVASALATSQRRVKSLIASGDLAAFNVAAPDAVRASLRVTPAALQSFIDGRTVKAYA